MLIMLHFVRDDSAPGPPPWQDDGDGFYVDYWDGDGKEGIAFVTPREHDLTIHEARNFGFRLANELELWPPEKAPFHITSPPQQIAI